MAAKNATTPKPKPPASRNRSPAAKRNSYLVIDGEGARHACATLREGIDLVDTFKDGVLYGRLYCRKKTPSN